MDRSRNVTAQKTVTPAPMAFGGVCATSMNGGSTAMMRLDDAGETGVPVTGGSKSPAGQAGGRLSTAGPSCPAPTEADQPLSVRKPFQRWIVVHHRADDGARVRIGIRREGFEVHWPREVVRQPRRDDRLRPFLPGYMFAYPLTPHASWHRIKATVPNVIALVGVRELGVPVSPPPGFVEALIHRAGGLLTGAIPLPEDAEEATPVWYRGMKLRVAAGPLAGTEALFQAERGPARIMALLTILGVPRMVEMDRSAVEADEVRNG